MDYQAASRVFNWLIEPRSHRARSWRSVALVVTLNGPQAFGCKTIGEVATLEGLSERSLRDLRNQLRIEFGIIPPAHVFAGDYNIQNSPNYSDNEPLAEILDEDETDFSAALPDI